ncbi:hypothetical protein A2311_03400 [candidate division WOR-1 bacterium RIFOXYB2_FULL_48_7]|uniref:Formate hydrogenlyase n=1 Tax=candidate division WOR-1 bacterium RIFOXYB2_FULL_48_7 TaxID=1802583 RepID=A0A1F4TRU8_UNCSA|nr:MAG: hypothetical protein A2311_03400 [candidate division WOR-1 bacterium RIFOXYB2_FULL_48_7]
MPELWLWLGQLGLVLSIAPLISGIITKIKNWLRFRRGPSIWQPYYNLSKLLAKDEIHSDQISWIYQLAPWILFSSTLTAAAILPLFAGLNRFSLLGDWLALLFLFALGRFFLALAALDCGSAFGGLGGGRELFVASLAEPVACLAVFALALKSGSSGFSAMADGQFGNVTVVVACLSLFLLTLAETSRLPVDNQETHLELTMIHEAMVLEYSGRPLALIEMSAHLRQFIWFFLLGWLIVPAISWLPLAMFILASAVAVLEVTIAKLRLFRLVDYFIFALAIGFVAVICASVGI